MSLTPVSFDPQIMSAWDEAPLWTARFGALLLENVPLAGARRVLDLGCGTGFPLFELARCLGPGSTCVGVDPWGIALARANFKRRAYGALDIGLVQGDGAALLNHWFVRLGFLDGWLGILRPLADEAKTRAVFAEIKQRLNDTARAAGELSLTIPMLYVEAERP